MPNAARKRLRESREDGGIPALGPVLKGRVGSPFGRNRKAAPETTTRAVTDIQLVEANLGKRDRLAAVAMEYMDAVAQYCMILSDPAAEGTDSFGTIPDVGTELSERWQRCAWQQACGTVASWRTNGRDKDGSGRPVPKSIAIKANANVVKIEPSDTQEFDLWLRISTLEKGQVIRVPVKIHGYGRAVVQDALSKRGWLASSCELRFVPGRRPGPGRWALQLVAHTPKERKTWPYSSIRGTDAGVANVITDSRGTHYGKLAPGFLERVEKATEKHKRKQKLNACLVKKGLPTVPMHDGRVQREARNEIGRAVNDFIHSLGPGEAVAKERLTPGGMKMKSRRMTRYLKAGQLGYASDLLERRMDEERIPYAAVNPAFTSQRCPECEFFMRANRPTQARFECLWCGYAAHADEVGASNAVERFHDVALNRSSVRQAETILLRRFWRRHNLDHSTGACSASAGLVLHSPVKPPRVHVCT
jgi:Putative transposase DNA-binding domain